MVEQRKEHCMYKRMMVIERHDAERLLELIDAVGRHNTRILIEKVWQPAQQTSEKTVKSQVLDALFSFGSVKNPAKRLPIAAV